MPRKVYVDTTYPKDALEKLYRSEANGRLKERLLAILMLYEGKTISEVSGLLKLTRQTLTNWLSAWNKGTYQGLKPCFSGGYAPRLSEQDWNQVVEQISGKGYDINKAREWILEQKGVAYSYKMVWYKLRKHYRLPYGKPYMENGKMPVDAKERIEKK